MINKDISHYRILEKLGEGGMGVVYKAEDKRLKRTVALKFLPQQILRSEEEKARFLREAQAAASLNHPHISTIYESDDVEGKTFIAMEYIDGQTLEKKIESGPLPIEEALNISLQVAYGLEEAHEKGIIHRDIKSANIMVTKKGQVKIMDFGLAKLSEGTKLTLTATVMGTVAYMSPEQAQGEEVDHRTDIWSLGIILYEMICGQLPFKGDHAQAVLYSILNEEPKFLTGLRSGVPLELERILKKALEKKKEDRYQHADEMITDLRRVQKMLKKPKQGIQKKKAAKRRRLYTSPFTWASVAVLIGLISAILIFYPKKSISFEKRDWVLVADFENTTGNEVFSGALEEGLERELSQSKYANIVPPERKYDTLRLMKKRPETRIDEEVAREVALRDGGIRAVLSGSIRQIGKTYVIAVKVMNPRSGMIVASFSEEAKSIDEILQTIHRLANLVRRKLGESLKEIAPPEPQFPRDWYKKVTTPHLQALKLYRRAFTYANQFNWEKALLFAQEAIEKDPKFAMAYALAGFMNSNTGREFEAKKYFEKALSLIKNITDREKYFILGGRALIFGDYEEAVKQYSILVDLYPDDFWGHANLFDAYLGIGSFQEAYVNLKEAARIRPNDPGTLGMLLMFELSYFENLEEGEQYYERIAQIAPGFDFASFQMFKSFERWIKGDLEGAEKEIQAALNRTQGYSPWTQYMAKMTLVSFEIYRGEFQKALEAAEKTGEFFRGKKIIDLEGDALMQSGLISRELGENEKFKNKMNFLLENFPDPIATDAALWLAYDAAAAGQKERAQRLLQRFKKGTIKEREKQAFIHLINGKLAQTEKNIEDAIKNFKQANQLVARMIHPPPHFYHPLLVNLALAEVYEEANQLDSAIEIFKKIVTHKIRSFLPSFTMGPFEWVKAHYHLGRLYQKKGDSKFAVEYYNKFLNLWKKTDRVLPEIKDAKERLKQLSLGD